jgi:hypothetical protein
MAFMSHQSLIFQRQHSRSINYKRDTDPKNQAVVSHLSNASVELEEDEVKELNNMYKYKESKCSCMLEDIIGFIYGGITSRFWIYRKHVLSMDQKDVGDDKNFPFFSWECITLQLKHREIDLVIRNQEHMKMFIRFLVYHLKTVDGNRNSAEGIHRALLK